MRLLLVRVLLLAPLPVSCYSCPPPRPLLVQGGASTSTGVLGTSSDDAAAITPKGVAKMAADVTQAVLTVIKDRWRSICTPRRLEAPEHTPEPVPDPAPKQMPEPTPEPTPERTPERTPEPTRKVCPQPQARLPAAWHAAALPNAKPPCSPPPPSVRICRPCISASFRSLLIARPHMHARMHTVCSCSPVQARNTRNRCRTAARASTPCDAHVPPSLHLPTQAAAAAGGWCLGQLAAMYYTPSVGAEEEEAATSQQGQHQGPAASAGGPGEAAGRAPSPLAEAEATAGPAGPAAAAEPAPQPAHSPTGAAAYGAEQQPPGTGTGMPAQQPARGRRVKSKRKAARAANIKMKLQGKRTASPRLQWLKLTYSTGAAAPMFKRKVRGWESISVYAVSIGRIHDGSCCEGSAAWCRGLGSTGRGKGMAAHLKHQTCAVAAMSRPCAPPVRLSTTSAVPHCPLQPVLTALRCSMPPCPVCIGGCSCW